MLRQLARLTRPITGASRDALAVAVYTDRLGHLVDAKESGYEGVACVDDAARLLDVLCDVWRRTRDDEVERWARGLLTFVLSMQGDGGRWWNFVYDWNGTRNETGITSATGENFWHARALCGTANAWRTFGDDRARAAVLDGLEHTRASTAPSDVRALHLELAVGLRDGSVPGIEADVRRWADEIASCRIDGVLMNNPDERGEPHLWAHAQEGALARAGVALGDDALVDVAVESARRLWVPVVRSGFDRASVTPYDVACATACCDALAEARPGDGWDELAARARRWFDLVDASGRAVYDRDDGRVADGVDDGRVSENAGAEANIVAAQVLHGDADASVTEARAILHEMMRT